jgi:two-component system sensor histidine kinase KdpD
MDKIGSPTEPDMLARREGGTDASWIWLRDSVATHYLAALAMSAIAAALAVSVDSQVAIPNISLIFVVPVTVAAVAFGLGPSLFAAILGALAYNFFLTEPRYTLMVDDPANIWAIGLLVVVGMIVSGVAFTARRRASEAGALARQVSMLHGYSRDLMAGGGTRARAILTAKTLAELFKVPALAVTVSKGAIGSVDRAGDMEPIGSELEAARSSLATGRAVQAGVYPAVTSRFDFWPVATGDRQGFVLGLAFDRPSVRRHPTGWLISWAGCWRLPRKRTHQPEARAR